MQFIQALALIPLAVAILINAVHWVMLLLAIVIVILTAQMLEIAALITIQYVKVAVLAEEQGAEVEETQAEEAQAQLLARRQQMSVIHKMVHSRQHVQKYVAVQL